jgi:hypothetical protein
MKLLLFGLVLGMAFPVPAQALFDHDSPLQIELTGPVGTLVKHKETRSEQPFRMKVGEQELDLQIRARGNSRMRICDFPPLKFNFNRTDSGDTVFGELDSLKLVTPCKKGARYQRDVLEEYAAYRIFGLLSPISFRVRLAQLTFNDTDKRLDESFREGFAFFIEPLERMAARVHGQLSDRPGVALDSLDEKQAALVYVFQYLIANTDWSLVAAKNDDSCCHNIELVEIASRLYPVPYDFDLAGLVNARYARPEPSLGIQKVRLRLYRGFCMNPDVLREAIAEIAAKEKDVLGVIDGLPLLNEKEKARQVDYLAKFFTMAGDEDELLRSFEKKCHP